MRCFCVPIVILSSIGQHTICKYPVVTCNLTQKFADLHAYASKLSRQTYPSKIKKSLNPKDFVAAAFTLN